MQITEYFQSIIDRKQFGHGYLIIGPQKTGKLDLARGFVKTLYCEDTSSKNACLKCQPCMQVEKQLHPDLQIIESEEDKHAISITQIRKLQQHIHQSPVSSTHTIGIINNAHEMSLAASNGLLKTLEEPSNTSILFLITHQPDLLPATIRSRSQILEHSKNLDTSAEVSEELQEEKNIFLNYLSLSKGQILKELEPLFKAKKKKHSNEKQEWYNRIEAWKATLRDLYMLKLEEKETSSSLSLIALQQAIDELSNIQTKFSQNVSIRLQIESFFLNLLI